MDSRKGEMPSRRTSEEMGSGRIRGKHGSTKKSAGNDLRKREGNSPTTTGAKCTSIMDGIDETTKRMEEMLWPARLVKIGRLRM